jgi:hypothetical protein
MGADLSQIAGWLSRLEAIEAAAPEVAREAAPLVEAALRQTAAAGQTPDGNPWPEKKGGGRALANAAEAFTVRVKGTGIVLTLRAPEKYHQFAKGKRLPQRRILPMAGAPLPAPVQKAVDDGVRKALARAASGGR